MSHSETELRRILHVKLGIIESPPGSENTNIKLLPPKVRLEESFYYSKLMRKRDQQIITDEDPPGKSSD